MAIPVVTLPKTGDIATRPRREPVYDTEGWVAGSAITGKLTIHRNTQQFQVANLGLGPAKVKGRDHNYDNAGGQLPKGQALHWFGMRLKLRPTYANMFGQANTNQWDLIRQIREVTWVTFYFGNTPYIVCQSYLIPEGVGVDGAMTTHNGTTYVSPVSTVLERREAYDVSLGGTPVEIGELESFSKTIESDTGQPTPTIDVYATSELVGVHLKGIQG